MADVGKQIKEGRHVGLDIYDLLIEELKQEGCPVLVALYATGRGF
jgi:hypothetical protein